MTGDATVRRAGEADRAGVVTTLARAFWRDPFIAFFYPDERLRARRIEPFFGLLWRANWLGGYIDIATNCGAAALWRPPGRWRVPRRTMVANLPAMLGTYGLAAGRVFASLAAMEREHLSEPHWYLMTLGTDPAMQGRGLAKALICTGLARCDAVGLPAYLESGDAANISFYERLGFHFLGETKIPNGPAFYPMLRPPAQPARRY